MNKIELQSRSRWILTTIIFSICVITLNIGWTLPFLYGGVAEFPIVKLVLPTILTFFAIALFILGLFIILPIIGIIKTDASDAES
ncbi:MAG: hypothetical protein ACFFDP_01815 [Promethearchaeota archaeon]